MNIKYKRFPTQQELDCIEYNKYLFLFEKFRSPFVMPESFKNIFGYELKIK